MDHGTAIKLAHERVTKGARLMGKMQHEHEQEIDSLRRRLKGAEHRCDQLWAKIEEQDKQISRLIVAVMQLTDPVKPSAGTLEKTING